MKKFSWIFALILALSIGFIGCPAADDDDGGGGGGGGGGPSGPSAFVPNPDATEIAVSFSASNPVSFEKADHSVAGSVTYDNGAYTYTYANKDTENANYGNAIGRFKVDLGDFRLGDYGGFSFGWTGISGDVGLSGGPTTTITYTKNLFILATDDEDALIPYVSDANIKTLVVNTDFYSKTGNAGKDLYDGAIDVPKVRGLAGYPDNQKPDGVTEPYPIATPIKLNKELTGEVWLAFYFHAANDSGSYKISNFKLVPFKDFVQKDPPPPPVAPPPVPADIPDGFVAITLDLGSYMTTVDQINDVAVPTVTKEANTITVAFTLQNQKINIPLTTEQKTLYYKNLDSKDAYVQIDCEIVGDDNENNFRYMLGVVNTGNNWNATGSPGDFPLLSWKGDPGGIAVSADGQGIKVTDSGKNDNTKARADYFVFQQRSATAVTVKINSIKIWVPPMPKFPTVSIATTDIKNNGATVTAITNGFRVVTTYGYQSAWIYFRVQLPAGKKLSDSGTLSFTIKGISVTGLSDGGGYKTASIYAFDVEPTYDNIKLIQKPNSEDPDPADWGQLKNLPTYKIGGGSGSTEAGIVDMDTAYDRAAPIALPDPTDINDDNDFWIAYQVGGSAGYTYEITNLKLVAGVVE
ncbi:hypothetical protein [Treponema sp. R6D11]